MRTPTRPAWVGLLLSLTLLLTACGGDPDPGADAPAGATGTGADPAPTPAASPSTDDGGHPVTVTAANGDVTIDERPERIVSLSPTATEMLFAIGAGDHVVAADSYSNHPPEAPTTDLSAFEPSVEAISEYEPDLVVLSFDPGDVVSGLEAIEVPTLLLTAATTLDDTYEQLLVLGRATGTTGQAQEVVDGMRRELDELVAQVPAFDEPPTYYHEIDPTYFTATSDTFIGQLYAMAGLENIADAAEGAAAAGGYPQLSAEYVIEADPDLIFLADAACCDVTPESVAQRPGWDRITAVEAGNVVPLDEDVVSRWGPRVVEFLRRVVEHVSRLPAA